jgi:hypothetical protein
VDAAILDIRRGKELVFCLAGSLSGCKIPFMFVTGYDDCA